MAKIRNYIKNSELDAFDANQISANSVISDFIHKINKRKGYFSLAIFFILILFFTIVITKHSVREVTLKDNDSSQMASIAMAATVSKGVISIPSGMVKANPFVPYKNINTANDILDVPTATLTEPPETIDEGSDAIRVMDTIVSGILYDKYSPSAIINIEGTDYLVKKGDVINNYKVINIVQDSVTVKLGNNVYKAGIGEMLTDGTLNRNNVSNLNDKFGGRK